MEEGHDLSHPRAAASHDGAKAYEAHFSTTVLPHLRHTDGFSGAYVLEREQEGEVALEVLTMWESLDAVRAFAGADIEAAVVEPEARAVLARFDSRVSHHAIAINVAAS